MEKDKDGYLSVTIGCFNSVSTIDGRTYRITEEKLRERLDKLIGHPLGEIEGASLIRSTQISGYEHFAARMLTVERGSQVGMLKDYDIVHGQGDTLVVKGHIEPSPMFQEVLVGCRDSNPQFGIRCFSKPRSPAQSEVLDITNLIGFDYIAPLHCSVKPSDTVKGDKP